MITPAGRAGAKNHFDFRAPLPTHAFLFTVELLKGSTSRPLPGFFP
ncbi:MAG: hypothetical protein UU09_C0020G0002 [Microgenomates group bacterium GW2011_GWA2_40_6]|nr:MAG: hypothetical protein UU09_C0020G0002 [Microgenomates group bacterium GW2011_GWA2_40_6]